MKKPSSYYIYILTNYNETTLYIGITNSIFRRTKEHQLHINKGFTDKYNLNKLVYYEFYETAEQAISREKQLKHWHREWKLNLVKKFNPTLKDLSKDFDEQDW